MVFRLSLSRIKFFFRKSDGSVPESSLMNHDPRLLETLEKIKLYEEIMVGVDDMIAINIYSNKSLPIFVGNKFNGLSYVDLLTLKGQIRKKLKILKKEALKLQR